MLLIGFMTTLVGLKSIKLYWLSVSASLHFQLRVKPTVHQNSGSGVSSSRVKRLLTVYFAKELIFCNVTTL
jgi:hypothetical protein